MTALARISVGIIVERRKAASQWIDYTWRPVAALAGQPQTPPWSVLHQDGEVTTYYAGTTEVALYRTETTYYRDNLETGSLLWVMLRPSDGDPPYTLFAVTADPAEGEGFTETGTDLVETVPMPAIVRDLVESFVADHHVEQQPFVKRKRDRANPEALARRGPMRDKKE